MKQWNNKTMDNARITTEDLYGTSSGEGQKPLEYKETPEVPMTTGEPTTSVEQNSVGGAVSKQRQASFPKTLGGIVIFGLLFAFGVWLSSSIRSVITPSDGTQSQVAQREEMLDSLEQPEEETLSGGSAANWKTYSMGSGIFLRLPPNVLAPICDNAQCASRGTYLPGGTRFTAALRGSGQALRDFRGSAIADANGTAFVTNDTTIQGRKAVEFTGSFTGTTVGGYAFSRMRGVMIAINETMSLEVNHFTPSGITADFDADDALFDQILESIVLSGYPQSNKEELSMTPAAQATPSGY